MRTIKLFEEFYSTLPQSMSMEDIKKLSPDELLKVAEETLKRGKGTDQNEFHTLLRTYAKFNKKFLWGPEGREFVTELGDLVDKYGLDPDAAAPVLGDTDPDFNQDDFTPPAIQQKMEDITTRIPKIKREIAEIQQRSSDLEARISMLRRKTEMDLRRVPGLEKELSDLESEKKDLEKSYYFTRRQLSTLPS